MSLEDSTAEVVAWSLAAARTQTLAVMADVPDSLWALQSEAREHPPAWVVGHLLVGDRYLLHLLGVGSLSPDFSDLLAAFGPEADSARPPLPLAREALLAQLGRTGELRSDVVRGLGALGLARPMPDAALATTQPTIAHHLNALVLHEGYHAGQLSIWRRLHGLPPTPWCLAPVGV